MVYFLFTKLVTMLLQNENTTHIYAHGHISCENQYCQHFFVGSDTVCVCVCVCGSCKSHLLSVINLTLSHPWRHRNQSPRLTSLWTRNPKTKGCTLSKTWHTSSLYSSSNINKQHFYTTCLEIAYSTCSRYQAHKQTATSTNTLTWVTYATWLKTGLKCSNSLD